MWVNLMTEKQLNRARIISVEMEYVNGVISSISSGDAAGRNASIACHITTEQWEELRRGVLEKMTTKKQALEKEFEAL